MSNNTAKESMGISVIQKLIDENNINDLLRDIFGSSINFAKIIETYDCSNEHTGLIVEAKNKITNIKERIIIDSIIGYPVTEQIYETVYNKGSKCDKRIIIYTEGFADLDEYGGKDDDAIKNLVSNLNAYGTNIFLVRLDESKNRMSLDYLVIQEPFERPDYKITDLPTEEKLKEEEFWEVYYWQQFEDGYYPWEAFTGDLHEPRKFGHVLGPDDGVEFYVKWTDQGLFFEATDQYDKIEYLESIWDNRKHELQMLFPDTETTFIFKPGKLPKLLVKIWSAPVQSLVNTTISEKKRLASEILEKFYDFVDFIIFRMNDLKHENGNV
jgi:hypothetical protein